MSLPDNSDFTSHAAIDWDDNDQPISNQFDDIYFSKSGGLDETRHVFLQQNNLTERFSQLTDHQSFIIGETGFGTGLNFLATCQLWSQVIRATKSKAQLDYIAVEKHPLQTTDLQRALSLWPELEPWSAPLLQHYAGVYLTGFQFFEFPDGIRLILIIDDAVNGFRQLLRSEHPAISDSHFGGVDAWFLDGFSPAKNPDMWQPALFDSIAKLSHSRTTLGTFTSAGLVKRGLQATGFNIEKTPGFRRKREQLRATFSPQKKPTFDDYPYSKRKSSEPIPWQVDQVNSTRHHAASRNTRNTSIAIVGAGLAGCHTAAALAKRGFSVSVFDQASRCAQGASGNPQGIVYGKLSKDHDPLARFNLAAILYAQQYYLDFFSSPELGEACGVLQLVQSPGAQKQFTLLREKFSHSSQWIQFLDTATLEKITGIDCRATDQTRSNSLGIFFPRLGWLSPPNVCHTLLSHSNITFQGNTRLQQLDFDQAADAWVLTFEDGESRFFSHVVVANANDCQQFGPTQHIPCKPIRGQVSVSQTPVAPQLKTVVCGDGYIAPADHKGQQTFGATFTKGDLSLEPTQTDHQANVSQLRNAASGFANIDEQSLVDLDGRAALRCTTPDYLPIVGPVPDEMPFCEAFALLRKNANSSIPRTGVYHPGLYINVGHGSRGLAYTRLSAQILGAQISGTPTPVGRDLETALNPARFLVRDLIRNRR